MQMDYSALAQRILRPDRPGLVEARAVVGEISDARHAWKALAAAGILGSAWIADPDRRFCGVGHDGSRSRWPTSVPMCLALAADISGAEAVEGLARDHVRALEPWGCPPHTRVAWSYGGEPGRSEYKCRAHAAAMDAAARNATPAERDRWVDEAWGMYMPFWEAYRAGGARGCLAVREDAVGAFWWRLATRRRGAVPPGLIPRRSRTAHRGLAGRRLRALRNPFESLLAIWQLGYACGEITADDIVLIVPEIE